MITKKKKSGINYFLVIVTVCILLQGMAAVVPIANRIPSESIFSNSSETNEKGYSEMDEDGNKLTLIYFVKSMFTWCEEVDDYLKLAGNQTYDGPMYASGIGVFFLALSVLIFLIYLIMAMFPKNRSVRMGKCAGWVCLNVLICHGLFVLAMLNTSSLVKKFDNTAEDKLGEFSALVRCPVGYYKPSVYFWGLIILNLVTWIVFANAAKNFVYPMKTYVPECGKDEFVPGYADMKNRISEGATAAIEVLSEVENNFLYDDMVK